jgi:hypothetical protein
VDTDSHEETQIKFLIVNRELGRNVEGNGDGQFYGICLEMVRNNMT